MDGLKIENLSFSWPDGKGLFNGSSFEVPSGNCAFFFGDKGSGKSSLLAILAGLSPRFIKGKLSGKRFFRGCEQFKAGSVLQDADSQFIGETAISEAEFFAANSRSFNIKRFIENCESLGISSLLKMKTSSLSSGEKKKLLLGFAACGHGESLLLVDEPCAYLDEYSRKVVVSFLKQLKANGASVCLFGSALEEFSSLTDIQFSIKCGHIEKGFSMRKDSPFSVRLKPHKPVLSFKNFSFSFGEFRIIENFSGTFYSGCLNGLTGPNGSGKTTLGKIAAGFLKGFSGIMSRPDRLFFVSAYPYSALMAQTIMENAQLFLGKKKAYSFFASRPELEPQRLVSSLSCRSAQILLIELALELRPDCIIIDEPLEEGKELWMKVKDYALSGGCPVIISHRRDFLESLCSHFERLT
ncbi:MAG: ABC transporter ATP-binding protein [Elusimicrobiota bacterium]